VGDQRGLAIDRGSASFWRAVRETFLKHFAQVYDELRPFAVSDLRLKGAT
jgi:hypothetical protein